jgi:hypothetical protein
LENNEKGIAVVSTLDYWSLPHRAGHLTQASHGHPWGLCIHKNHG